MPSLVFNQQTRVDPAFTPADAQGAHFSEAIGTGLQRLGATGEQLASNINRVNFMQQEADGIAQLQKNMSEGYRNFATSIDQWKGDPKIVQQNGSGLTQKFVDAYSQWTNQLVEQQTTPRLKRMAAEQARTLGDHFFNQTHSWEVESNRAWRVGSIQDSITTDAATIQQNPDTYGALLKDKLDAISELSPELHPTDRITLAQKAKGLYAEAAALGHAEKAPQDTVNVLTGQQPLARGSVPQKIVEAAKAKGVDPQAALAIAQFESGMDPAAVNGQSVGLYQMQPDFATQYGVTDRTNVDQSISGAVASFAANQRGFRDTFKRDPTLPELYAMHLLGTGGGMALTKAPNDQPFAEVAARLYGKNAQAVQNANHLAGMSVGQVKAQLASWMQSAVAKTAGMASAPPPGETGDSADMPPYFRELTPQGRQAILTHAQTILRRDDSTQRAAVAQRISDETAAYQRGEAVPNPLSVGDLVSAGLPISEATQRMQTLQTWQQFGAQYAKVKSLPPAQQDALYEASAPTPGQPGYAVAAQAHDALGKAIEHVNQQRVDDPIRYDQGDGLHTTQPLDFTRPDVFTVQMSRRYAQAVQVARNSGTSYQPFSKTEAWQIGQMLTQGDAQQSLQNLALMRNAAPSQDYFNAAMAQVAPNHPVLAAAGQLAQSNPQAAFTVLQGDRILHPLDGKSSAAMPTPEKFRERWDADMGLAYQGLPQTAQADQQAVMAYYAARVPPGKGADKGIDEATWKEALAAVVPSTPYNHRPTLVPPGVAPERFPDLIAERWPGAVKAAGLDPSDYPVGAYQLSSGGIDGVYVAYQGTTPLLAHGKPVVLDLNAPQAPPAEPPAAQRPPMKGRKLTIDDIKRFR